MAVRIRLARMGSKKKPYYRIVAADSHSPRDGRFLDRIGTYNPMIEEIIINDERLNYWSGVGALPTTTVARLIRKYRKAAAPAPV